MQVGSRGGCLKRGEGAGTPLPTMNLYYDCKNIEKRLKYAASLTRTESFIAKHRRVFQTVSRGGGIPPPSVCRGETTENFAGEDFFTGGGEEFS